MNSPSVVPILLYHSVCNDPAPLMERWAITPARFREHLDFLAADGYRTLTVSEFVACLRDPGASMPERAAVVTFDDGFADFVTGALPALTDTGTACTLYVSTAYVGSTSSWLGPDGEQPMLTWEGVDQIATSGVEIGAHAHHHVALDELHAPDAEHEITHCKELLEDRLGREVDSFAYPHGYHGAKVRAMVQRAGFRSACGVKHALSGPGDDEFGLARVMLEGDVTVDALRSMLNDLPRAPSDEKIATKAWRTYRRTRARVRPASSPTTTGAS